MAAVASGLNTSRCWQTVTLHDTEGEDAALIAHARQRWALADDVVITLVAARENRVYQVRGKGVTAALRLHRRGYRTEAQIRSELQWMDMLACNGVTVPRPLPATDAALLVEIDGVLIDMLTWVDGTPLSKLPATEAHYTKLGRELARMHKLADEWQLPADFTRPTWDLVGDNPSWGRFWQNPMLNRQQTARLLQFREDARAELSHNQHADIGLIHADLVPDNVLYNNDQPVLIDFDDGGFGYRLFDLATITHRSRRDDPQGHFANAAVQGYCSERLQGQYQPEAKQLRAELPLFEAMRACSYVGWIISRVNEQGSAERSVRLINEADVALDRYAAFQR